MPSADKRQRKKENARVAREARAAEIKKHRRNRTIRNAAIAGAVFVAAILIITWVSGGNDKKKAETPKFTTIKVDPAKTYTATIKTTFGPIVLTLDAKNDPIAAGHFVSLAKAGLYDGSTWSRIAKDFVIQGGAPGGDGSKSVGDAVVGELSKNHYPVGTVAAAKKGNDPAGTYDSQFFIVTGAQQGASLPNDYARIGTVKSGTDAVNKIAALAVDSNEAPTSKAAIDSVTISVK